MLLWAAGEPDQLADATRALLLDEANRLFFSVASIWEVVIKRGLGRDDFRVEGMRLVTADSQIAQYGDGTLGKAVKNVDTVISPRVQAR